MSELHDTAFGRDGSPDGIEMKYMASGEAAPFPGVAYTIGSST